MNNLEDTENLVMQVIEVLYLVCSLGLFALLVVKCVKCLMWCRNRDSGKGAMRTFDAELRTMSLFKGKPVKLGTMIQA
jgi:hypothetical protein